MATISECPILMIQWLKNTEYKEVFSKKTTKAGGSVDVAIVDAKNKAEVKNAIERWLVGNSNAQYLYIGTHGNEKGLSDNGEFASYEEVWQWFSRRRRPFVVWLGACRSVNAATVWSRCIEESPAHIHVSCVVGFDDDTTPSRVEDVLILLLERCQTTSPVSDDLEILRQNYPHHRVKMHYLASPLPPAKGWIRYVDTENFAELIGESFEQYIASGKG